VDENREFHIKVEAGRSLEDTADWLAMSASAILNELFPEQWREGLTLIVQRINEKVREDES
jgi:hypothetical protein